MTGETSAFTSWIPGQPDAAREFACVGNYWLGSGGAMGWDDASGLNTPLQGFLVEWDDAGTTPKPMAPAVAPAPTVPALAPPSLPPAPTTPKQTVDLIGSLDLTKDRVQAGSFTKANAWEKTGNVLTYKSDGSSGKVTAPVSLNGLRDYEVGVLVRRLSGTGPFTLDLPLSETRQSGLDLLPRGIELGLVNGQRQKIGDWPQDATGDARVVARVRFAADGRNGSVSVTVNGKPAAQWEGALADMGRPIEFHPEFPGQQTTSLFCFKDSFAFAAWQLRVYEGEARVMRAAPVAGTAPPPAIPPMTASTNKAGKKLFDGRTLNGWRFQGLQAFAVRDGCLKTTGDKGNLMFTGNADVSADMKDFDLTMKVKTTNRANSGVFIHCPRNTDGVSFINGIEAQIANENQDPEKTGSLWSIKAVNEILVHDEEWFDFRIRVKGRTVTTYVNDKQVLDWTQPEGWQGSAKKKDAKLGGGTIGLQSNGGITWFKDIEFRLP